MIPGEQVDFDDLQAAAEGPIKKFNAIMEFANKVIVGRNVEIELIMLAILTKQHVMLCGQHGIAKSLLATTIFDCFTDATTFKIQLMKSTQTDQVFGPLNMTRYQKDAVWEHNTEGHLPRAHFAFLDEFYRAADMVLPSMMSLLNERVFYNGATPHNCPLVTAIGTTNLVTESAELDAVHDRFLFWAHMNPLDSNSRLEMLNSQASYEEVERPDSMSLHELSLIQEGLKAVTIDQDVVQCLSSLHTSFVNKAAKGSRYISDRRVVQTLSLLRAAAFLQGEREVDSSILASAEKVWLGIGRYEAEESVHFASALDESVKVDLEDKEELKMWRVYETRVNALVVKVDKNTTPAQAKQLLAKINDCIKTMTTVSEKPSTATALGIYNKCSDHLHQSASFLEAKL